MAMLTKEKCDKSEHNSSLDQRNFPFLVSLFIEKLQIQIDAMLWIEANANDETLRQALNK